jgi:hypothetical protein
VTHVAKRRVEHGMPLCCVRIDAPQASARRASD